MMIEANAISRAFLENHPKAAAAFLQRYSAEEVAEFVDSVPLPALVRIVHEMASWPGARVLSLLPDPTVANVLRELHSAEAETLLRLLDEEKRESVVAGMPSGLAKSFRRKLAYPLVSIGAWMDTSVPHFTADNTVNDCIDLVRQRKTALGGVLMVVDYHRQFVGLLEVEKLLTSDGNQVLSELVVKDLKPLHSRETLGEVMEDEGWIRFSTLPVVDHNGLLLGVLTHSALLSGSAKLHRETEQKEHFSLHANMAKAFFVSLSGLLALVFGVSGDREDPRGTPLVKQQESQL